jgi:hypothetical protein
MSESLEAFRQSIQVETQAILADRLINCRANPKYAKHARIIEEVLNERFPGWGRPRARRGGKRPTVARFKGREQEFESARDAYVWLVERFADAAPTLFMDVRWETTGYFAVGRRRNRSGHAQRNYFAKSPKALFRRTQSLADVSSHYRRLSNGWYVNLNLNPRENFEILCRLSAVAGAAHGADWDWEVLDPSEELRSARQRQIAAKELQREIDEWLREVASS